MEFLDGLLGSFRDGEAEKLVGAFLDQHGGIDGVAAQFEKQGLGGTVESWLGDTTGKTVTADQIHQVFGADGLRAIAGLTGMSTQDIAQKLADHLPGAVAQRQSAAATTSPDDGDEDRDDSGAGDNRQDDSEDDSKDENEDEDEKSRG